MPAKRNYKREVALQSKQDIKDRALRNKARREMEKLYGKEAIKGKDIGHIKSLDNGGKSIPSNLRIESVKENRSRKEGDFKAGRPKKGKAPKARHKVKSRKP